MKDQHIPLKGGGSKSPFLALKETLLSKIAVTTLSLGLIVSALPGAEAADTYTPDGKTSQTAAASCWEAKQVDPNAASGTYWLWTPELGAPEQFYCDQETDGGGWLMIGRGREGWSENYNGKGRASDLYNNPDGTDAFAPVQLPGATIEALLAGQRVSDLNGGFRVRRAANDTGTRWQNVTTTRAQAQEWSWALSATQTWTNTRFTGGSPTGSVSNASYATLTGQMMRPFLAAYQVNFVGTSAQGWNLGFAYGSSVYGRNNSTTHLWSRTGSSPLPFAQLFLRPKVTQSDLNLSEFSDSGVAGSQRQALPNSYSSKVLWRTSEQTGTGRVGELNTYVQAITQVGNTVFTGGDFAWVENAVTGERVQQKFIAGYDVNTGELVRSFLPQLNGQVKSLEALPSGQLVVGGEFTTVNGEDAPGLVLLDPATGQIDTQLGFGAEQRGSDGIISVRSLDVVGNYLYVAGRFSHIRDEKRGLSSYSRNAGRFDLATGTYDSNWRPNVNGTVNGVSAAQDGQTVGFAGYFTEVNQQRSWKLALVDTDSTSLASAWNWERSSPWYDESYQQDIEDVGSTIWAGGVQHMIHHYDKRNGLSRVGSSIALEGGDFQDLYYNGNGVLYGACHCGDYIYEGSSTWSQPWTNRGLRSIHSMRLSSAFDAASGKVLPEFAPNLHGARGEGVWEQFIDSNGTLWLGGDINQSIAGNGSAQKTVGFVRYEARDITAPAVTSNLAVTSDGATDVLTWAPVSGARYQILRNNRVIATTDAATYSVDSSPTARYFVRTVDSAGNYSASTPVASATRAAAPQPPTPEEPAAEEPAPDQQVPEEPALHLQG